ncbi:MAG: PAS domain S-box protein [Candidatus Glassbacteria bacterium]|nr:PAS domain S-box protein [Candidatus Glassbacteria bacterium]
MSGRKPTYRELKQRVEELEGIIEGRLPGQELRQSREMLEMVLENFPQRIFYKDLSGVYRWCNKLFARDAGVEDPEKIIGKTDHELAWTKDEADFLTETDRRIMETDTPEYRNLEPRQRKDGEPAWFEINRIPLHNLQGEVVGVLGTYQDVTEREQMELALWESEQRLESILSTVPDIIYRLDAKGKVVFISDAVRKFGYTAEELVGKSLLDIIHPDDKEKAVFRINERRTGIRSAQSLEVRLLTKEQDSVPFQLSFRNVDQEPVMLISAEGIYDSDKPERKRFLGTQGIARDITERIQAEEEKEHRNQQLLQADKMISLGVLVAGVAHEINNPNNFIMMNAPILQRAWENIGPVLEEYYRENGDFIVAGVAYSAMRDRIPELFNGISEGAGRIKNIVQNLKDYARQESRGLTEDVDVNAVLKSALTLLSNLLRKSTGSLSVKYADRLPRVRGNFQRIEQVLMNVIQNACQALPDPGRSIAIRTRYDPENRRVIVNVRDEGVGIPKKDLKRILDPFYTTKRDSGGTGLGLSVSAGIMEDHGGKLEFSSSPGKGTVVSVILPAAPQAAGS